jgi:hypothetical protein
MGSESHYQDSQRLRHIQHRKRGKTKTVDAANLPTPFWSDLHGAIDRVAIWNFVGMWTVSGWGYGM